MKTAPITLTEFYHRFPKADLHYHLLGGVRLETMLWFANKYDIVLSELEAKAYYRAYQAETGIVKGGIEALTFLYQLMREPSDYAKVLLEVAEDAHACGVKYIETFWNPSDTPLSYAEVTCALADAIDSAYQNMGIVIRLIPSINREKSPEQAIAMVEDMIAAPHPYVLGIGIDYKEHDAPVEKFWKAYRLAKQHGYKLTAHCSEFGLHWRNVETGIELIGVDRIDHGYTIIDNPALTKEYAEKGIPFTVIPSNTYYFKQWPRYQDWCWHHPIRAMAKAGMNIIPCTDDWHIHNTDSANCYRVMVEDFGFDLESLKQMMLNSIEACWMPDSTKQQWLAEWSDEFDLLRSKLTAEPSISPEMKICYRR
ncbi:adenosine deaminase (plasmid) [Photobacterium sp. DA100]|uniref:adenosine deaminase family protein n=1 Tax=Photobacterium sp. DA100 TaxID=3027472 RepID=UPI002478D40B|nr:adenosine deaminase [Photobacterium sp. DA100]WEM45566.1 adenosine deaminase [Photobacterium sp. DA100]